MEGVIKSVKSQNEEVEKLIKQLPLKERVKVLSIYHYTLKKQNLDSELEEKIQKLQKQSDYKALPIYEQQNQIILGQRAATSEELVDYDKYFTEAEQTEKEQYKSSSAQIKGYWAKVVENCEEIQLRVNPDGKNEKDSEVLQHLQRIQLETNVDSNDFTLIFHFTENQHFTNTELKKKMIFPAQNVGDEETDLDFPIKCEATEINWNEGKNITKKIIQKKQKNKKTGASRVVNKTVDCDSFFNFFRNLSLEDKDKLDDEAADELDLKMENDFEIARTIQDEVIPYSLEYYLGINPEHEDDECDDEDCDDDHHEHGHGEDNEDSEDDDHDKKKSKKNRKKSGDSKKSDDKAPGKASEKPECKQQ